MEQHRDVLERRLACSALAAVISFTELLAEVEGPAGTCVGGVGGKGPDAERERWGRRGGGSGEREGWRVEGLPGKRAERVRGGGEVGTSWQGGKIARKGGRRGCLVSGERGRRVVKGRGQQVKGGGYEGEGPAGTGGRVVRGRGQQVRGEGCEGEGPAGQGRGFMRGRGQQVQGGGSTREGCLGRGMKG